LTTKHPKGKKGSLSFPFHHFTLTIGKAMRQGRARDPIPYPCPHHVKLSPSPPPQRHILLIFIMNIKKMYMYIVKFMHTNIAYKKKLKVLSKDNENHTNV
jgi:hypothetical protein